MDGIRLRTQFSNITFHVKPDGELLLNGEPVAQLFPGEYEMIAIRAEEAESKMKEAA